MPVRNSIAPTHDGGAQAAVSTIATSTAGGSASSQFTRGGELGRLARAIEWSRMSFGDEAHARERSCIPLSNALDAVHPDSLAEHDEAEATARFNTCCTTVELPQ